MTILTSEEIEQYRELRLADSERIRGIGQPSLERLKLLEQELGNLPFYLATKYHIDGLSLTKLGRELDVNREYVSALFKHHEIPIRTRNEILKKNWENPEYRERAVKSMKNKWEDPEYREARIKERDETATGAIEGVSATTPNYFSTVGRIIKDHPELEEGIDTNIGDRGLLFGRILDENGGNITNIGFHLDNILGLDGFIDTADIDVDDGSD